MIQPTTPELMTARIEALEEALQKAQDSMVTASKQLHPKQTRLACLQHITTKVSNNLAFAADAVSAALGR